MRKRGAPRLFAELATARGEGRLPRLLAMLERTRRLIIDDRGPEPLTAGQRRDLLEIVDDRYEKGSLLITSQVPVTRWHELVGNPTLGDAILDRVVHRLELKGPSLRKRLAVAAAPRIRYRRRADHRSRPQRWHDAVAELLALQADDLAWHEALPDSLRDTATDEAHQAIVDLDLTDLAAIVPPRGYGRDGNA